ncbi:MAG: bifunctional DNA primase/polymerase [Pseudomonadota bacterium]
MNAVLPDRRAMNVPEAAAAWCALGWQVVPMGPDKRPLSKWKGAASETPTQALARFARLPRGAGLAIALPAGVMVLDVDHRPARGWDGALILAALIARFGLPAAPTVETPSGGRHIWLALPVSFRHFPATTR